MNTQLTEQLRIANNTITCLYENYFDPSDELRNQAVENYHREKGWAKRLSWLAGIVIFGIFANIFPNVDQYSITFWVPPFVSIISGLSLYAFVLEPKVTDRYYATDRKADELKEEGIEYLRKHIKDVNCLTPDYWFPMATTYMYKIASAGRADTIKEALAMTDEQLHRWKVEGSYTRLLEEQRKQSATLKQIGIDTAINTMINASKL